MQGLQKCTNKGLFYPRLNEKDVVFPALCLLYSGTIHYSPYTIVCTVYKHSLGSEEKKHVRLGVIDCSNWMLEGFSITQMGSLKLEGEARNAIVRFHLQSLGFAPDRNQTSESTNCSPDTGTPLQNTNAKTNTNTNNTNYQTLGRPVAKCKSLLMLKDQVVKLSRFWEEFLVKSMLGTKPTIFWF